MVAQTSICSFFLACTRHYGGFPDGTVVKSLPANAGDAGDSGSIPGLGRSSGEGNGSPFQYSLPGKSHGQRSLMGYSPCSQSRT